MKGSYSCIIDKLWTLFGYFYTPQQPRLPSYDLPSAHMFLKYQLELLCVSKELKKDDNEKGMVIWDAGHVIIVIIKHITDFQVWLCALLMFFQSLSAFSFCFVTWYSHGS